MNILDELKARIAKLEAEVESLKAAPYWASPKACDTPDPGPYSEMRGLEIDIITGKRFDNE